VSEVLARTIACPLPQAYARRQAGAVMHYTFEFYRIRPGDKAHATLERVQQEASDLERVIESLLLL
jgi:hypothetical protein